MPAGNFTEPGCVYLIRWLGGIETPRLNVTRVPPRSSPEAWGHDSATFYANASRHRAAVSFDPVGAQAALVPHHVRNRLGRGIVAAPGGPGRRLSQWSGETTGHPRTEHYVYVSRTHSGSRGQHAIRAAILLHLQRLSGDPQ